jgi:hypothetical protein
LEAASITVPVTHFIMSDPTIRSGGHTYQHITTGGSASAHYGDNHYYTLAEDERIKALLLESLRFPEMRWRRDAVYEAREETWLYDTSIFELRDYSDARIAEARADLVDWLGSDNDKLFWISGKPGSGKSVFMKRLRNHANTASLLRKWADGTTLVVLEHYFWVAGASMQSSWLGLLRTLLHDCVSALTIQNNHTLLKTVFSDRWNFGSQHVPWTYTALQSAIQHIFHSASVKVVVFVDGLDECLPQQDLDLLVESLLDMCKWPKVKICASSRPWPAFEHGFEASFRIKLESLTSREMHRYVRDQLIRAESAQSLVRDFRDNTAEAKTFVRQVVKQAEGVFLWTSLVVKHISSERRRGRRFDRLRKCLESFPEDLEAYFRALVWGRIPGLKTNKTETACVLFLALSRTLWGCLPYYLLSQDLLGPELGIFAIDPQWHASLSSQDVHDHISLFLAETCGDLLTLERSSNQDHLGTILSYDVEFPHRTMLDFFETAEMKVFLEGHVPANFLKACFWKKAKVHMAAYKLFAESRIPGPSEIQSVGSCEEIENCWMLILEYAEESGDLVNIDPHKQRWLLTCEQLALEHLREACRCGGEYHSLYDALTTVWSLGMYRYIREVLLKWPHLALCKRKLQSFNVRPYDRHLGPIAEESMYRSPLETAVQMRRGSGYETPHRSTISQLLGAGCDPNQLHVGLDDSRHSIWGFFVARWWNAANGNAEIQETQAFVEVVILLIRHGAYTWYPTCTAAHTSSLKFPGELCQWSGFETIVKTCVPANQQHELMQIVTEYSEESRRCHTNRKQKLLAFRSLRTSLLHELAREQLPSTYSLGDILERSFFGKYGFLVTSISDWIGLPLKPPQCSHHDRSRPTMFRKAHVCLDCAGFPTICTECLTSDPQAHNKHYVLLIHVSNSCKRLDKVLNVRDLERFKKFLWEPWKVLFESSNRWFEARAEDGGVAMAESPTTENPYGHPFIPMAPKIELPSLSALTSNGEDEKDLPRYCLAII